MGSGIIVFSEALHRDLYPKTYKMAFEGPHRQSLITPPKRNNSHCSEL